MTPTDSVSGIATIHQHSEGLIEIRSFENGIPAQAWFETPQEAEAFARTLDGTADSYFGMGTRLRESGTKADVKEIPGLWADCDSAESVEAISRFPLKPTLIVETSPGRAHFYWLFHEPLLIEGDTTVALVEAVLKGIADRLNSDPAVCEVARIMRVPGSYNIKKKSRGRILKDDGPRYELSDFIDLGIIRTAKTTPASSNGDGGNWVAEALKGVGEGERNHTAARLAGYLVRHEPHDIAEAILEGFGTRCRPPMDPEELRKAFASIDKTVQREGAVKANNVFVEIDVLKAIREGVPPVKFDITRFMVAGTLTIISGAPKSAKTWLALLWTICLVTGRSFCGLKVSGEHRVLFLEAEYPRQIIIRFEQLCRGLQVNPATALAKIRFIRPKSRTRLEDPTHAAALLKTAQDFGATWVVVDSLRRVQGCEENSSKEMSSLFDGALLPLRGDDERGVLIVDHDAKAWQMGSRSKSQQLRGSGDKLASSDVLLNVQKHEPEGEQRRYELSVAASRVSEEDGESLWLAIQPSENDGIELVETEPVEVTRTSTRKSGPGKLEQAVNVIEAESGRNPNLTYTDALKAVVNAGFGKSTGVRAWHRFQVPKVPIDTLKPETKAGGGSRFQGSTPPLGGGT